MNTIRKSIIGMTLVATVLLAGAFSAPAQTAMATKSVDAVAKADPAAYDMLKSARDSRQTFPERFSGVAAEIVYNENGKIYAGTLDYAPKIALQVTVQGLSETQHKQLEDEVGSLLMHRRGGDFNKGDGKYPLSFGTEDGSPLGRLINLNDDTQSSYRIRDNQVVQVNRAMGTERFTINVLETTPTPGGKFLPRQFTVAYFDDKSGALLRTEAYTDSYAQLDGVWLPSSRRVITSEKGQTTVRIIEFRKLKTKPAVAQAAK